MLLVYRRLYPTAPTYFWFFVAKIALIKRSILLLASFLLCVDSTKHEKLYVVDSSFLGVDRCAMGFTSKYYRRGDNCVSPMNRNRCGATTDNRRLPEIIQHASMFQRDVSDFFTTSYYL